MSYLNRERFIYVGKRGLNLFKELLKVEVNKYVIMTTINFEDTSTIVDIRRELDYNIQLMRKLRHSREMSLVITSLENARMFLGDLMGILGVKSPYSSGKTEISDIEPPSDKYTGGFKDLAPVNEIQEIDILRNILKKLYTNLLLELHQYTNDDNGELSIVVKKAYVELKLARFRLGCVLGEIKEENK